LHPDPWRQTEETIAAEICDFRRSLSTEDRAIFASGHRLARRRRDDLLALFSPEVIRIKGWRFSDEPVADALADTEETQH
jgi:hypothetical protein